MLEVFDVIFDGNPEGIYHQGDVVKGHVKIALTGHKKLTNLSTTFRGEASTYTSWLHKRGTGLSTEQCGASEMYFEENLTMVHRERFLQSGVHVFPFEFIIPRHLNLPASFEGDHGHVKYYVSARLNTYLYTKKIFTVIGEKKMVSGIDCLLSAMAPVSSSNVKMFPYLCCFSGHVTLFAQTDRKGYMPGNKIILCGSIVNQSHHQIYHLCIRLVQKAIYATSTELKGGNNRILVEETHEICCDGPSSVTFSNKWLCVPACAPSGLPGCGIIDIEYFVQVEADVSVWLPVDIGICGILDTTFHGSDGMKSDASSVCAKLETIKKARKSASTQYTIQSGFNHSKSDPSYIASCQDDFFAPPSCEEDLSSHHYNIPYVTVTSPDNVTYPMIIPAEDYNHQHATSVGSTPNQVLSSPIIAPPDGFTDDFSADAISSQSAITSVTASEGSSNHQSSIPLLTPLGDMLPTIPLSEEEDIDGQPTALPMMPSKDFITDHLAKDNSTLQTQPVDESSGHRFKALRAIFQDNV